MKKIWELESWKSEDGGWKLLFNQFWLPVYNTN
ncbi:hypothetical protein M2372_000651 [Chryseobacterium sp. BIGb0232]|nr:hypothetical protein [Chryseobacterium sp. BIGb0232]